MTVHSNILRTPLVYLRKAKWRYLAGMFCLLSFVVFEEMNVGVFFSRYMNFYTSETLIPVRMVKTGSNLRIALAIVVKDQSNAEQYALARETVRCYAALQKYDLHEVDVSANSTLTDWCPGHTDFMFVRHCVLSHLMREWTVDWILFIDADMAVINPNHFIEEYVPNDNSTVVFYNRIMNHEIMAGSYLIRNSESGREFLQSWADYESRLPDSFHGSDNGAIHSVVLEWSLPYLKKERKSCERLWKEAKNYVHLYEYEACTRTIMAKHPPPGIKILPKGRVSWARDGWLSENMWSQSDFILHGWQTRRQDQMGFGRWHSPLISNDESVSLAKCADSETAHQMWKYKNTFIGTDEEIMKRIYRVINDIEVLYNNTVQSLIEQNYIWW